MLTDRDEARAERDAALLQIRELQKDLAHWKDCHGATADKLEESNRLLDRTQKALYGISCSCVSNVVYMKCQRCAAIESLAFVEKRVDPVPKVALTCCCLKPQHGAGYCCCGERH